MAENKQLIYKIVHKDQWAQAEQAGVFEGAEIDLTDGYIHFSDTNQVKETANKYFAGIEGLLLVAVDAADLGDALKWEAARNGDLFPHLYSTLDPKQAVFVRELVLTPSGEFQFPDLSGQ